MTVAYLDDRRFEVLCYHQLSVKSISLVYWSCSSLMWTWSAASLRDASRCVETESIETELICVNRVKSQTTDLSIRVWSDVITHADWSRWRAVRHLGAWYQLTVQQCVHEVAPSQYRFSSYDGSSSQVVSWTGCTQQSLSRSISVRNSIISRVPL